MKKLALFLLSAILMIGTITAVEATEIQLPDLIGDHMLLQQGKPIRLWGNAAPGEIISIELCTTNTVYSQGTATAGSDGAFQAELPAVTAGGPYRLIFTSPSSTVIVEDVLVGELWIQSGQSNMAKLVNSTGNYASEILPDQTMDKIRIFINTKDESSSTREKDLEGSWKIADRSTVNAYSAVGYSALNKLYQELDLPVGGICCAIGGAGMAAYQGPSEAGNTGGTYYNKKVAPLTQLSTRGVMWYQGEGDRGNVNFSSDFKKLITSWRTDWQDSDMPFLFVALPPSPMKYYASWTGNYIMEDFSTARLGQLQTYHEMENVGIAVSMDCPPNQGEDSLHPNNKKPVGERLALSALGLIYGTAEKWFSPLYQSASVSGNSAVITFSHSYDGLKTTDHQAPRCFMAAGTDGQFYEASAVISGKDTVTITCPQVSQIKTISYGVEKHMYPYTSADNAVIDTYADVNLVNSEGLPLCPFSYEITEVKAEKFPLYCVEPVESIAALNEPYCFDKTVSLIKADGQVVQQNVLWSKKTINTAKEGIVTLYGLAENADVMIPARVTVKQVYDTPLPGPVSIVRDDNKVTISVPIGITEANRMAYVIAGFYDENGTFLSAQPTLCALLKGQTGQLTLTADIPAKTTKIKAFVLNPNLRPYLPVTELEINQTI